MSSTFDLSGAWALDDHVALRPEAFGALAYHFDTRRLSFLKSPILVKLVERLGDYPTAQEACGAVGLETMQGPMLAALETLARTGMIVPREQPCDL
jgi:mycofactocin biosynthesis protein MftB